MIDQGEKGEGRGDWDKKNDWEHPEEFQTGR